MALGAKPVASECLPTFKTGNYGQIRKFGVCKPTGVRGLGVNCPMSHDPLTYWHTAGAVWSPGMINEELRMDKD